MPLWADYERTTSVPSGRRIVADRLTPSPLLTFTEGHSASTTLAKDSCFGCVALSETSVQPCGEVCAGWIFLSNDSCQSKTKGTTPSPAMALPNPLLIVQVSSLPSGIFREPFRGSPMSWLTPFFISSRNWPSSPVFGTRTAKVPRRSVAKSSQKLSPSRSSGLLVGSGARSSKYTVGPSETTAFQVPQRLCLPPILGSTPRMLPTFFTPSLRS
mmetsp:Transcript_35556/g.65870  ORF Transcript_35556/g.65870 Transcript_35556/m.65870 type:complete len:214 (+) Transcript_35556:194-835(+)